MFSELHRQDEDHQSIVDVAQNIHDSHIVAASVAEPVIKVLAETNALDPLLQLIVGHIFPLL